MAETPSYMIPLDTQAPDFTLQDVVSGNQLSLSDNKSDVATVIMFIFNHCPYVILIREKLAQVAKEYQSKGVHFIAINSNDVSQYPEDSPKKMKQAALEFGFTFPYLYDETQE